MANVTFTLDEDLLIRARARARERGMSLNAVVREYLEDYAGPSEAAAAIAQLLELADRSTFSVGENGITWQREDLHDRANLR
jgi:hypothetical protein